MRSLVKKRSFSPYMSLMTVILVITSMLFIFPFFWIITGSFKDSSAINIRPPQWLPISPTTENFTHLFIQPAWRWMLNSIMMSLTAMVLVCIVASLAGYVLAKKRFPGRLFIFSLLIGAMALPKQVILIPLVRMMNTLGLYDTL